MALDSMKQIFERMPSGGNLRLLARLSAPSDMEERQVTAVRRPWRRCSQTWLGHAGARRTTYQAGRQALRQRPGRGRRRMKMRDYRRPAACASDGRLCQRGHRRGPLRGGVATPACGRIVAAPTAGACGVLPAVLLPLCRKYDELAQHQLLEALYVAAGIGAVIACRACIAGAVRRLPGGDRQRRRPWRRGRWWPCGAAAAQQIGHAVAMALKNLLGARMRPGRGTGGGAVRQAERHRRGQRRERGGHGPRRDREPHPRRRGDRLRWAR